MYQCAESLIEKGLAYVCELSPEQFKEYRGDVNVPARSPYRDRPAQESLDLFRRRSTGAPSAYPPPLPGGTGPWRSLWTSLSG